MKNLFAKLNQHLAALKAHPRPYRSIFNLIPALAAGTRYAATFPKFTDTSADTSSDHSDNPLLDYFNHNTEGNGIFKWEHYFEIYHRHFQRFRERPIRLLEIGIYSGGSLEMWQSYFAPDTQIVGVDIEPDCMSYQKENITIHIGDQEDRDFWRRFKNDEPPLDIIIDDGGHTPTQQQFTLEEMLTHLKPGGIYLCEDVHHRFNPFTAFVTGLVHELNQKQSQHPGAALSSATSPLQSAIYSIHFYPYVIVIEKNHAPRPHLTSCRNGTVWQPFM